MKGYYKLNEDGYLMSSQKKMDNTWKKLDGIPKLKNGKYSEYYKLINNKLVIDIEPLKKQKINEIKNKVSEIIKSKYSIEKQINIISGIDSSEEDKTNFKNFVNELIKQKTKFIGSIEKIKKDEDLENFMFKFEISE